MKVPVPFGSATAQQVTDLIDSGEFFDADLYTITLFGGGVLRLTTANFDITDDVNVWSSKGARIDTKRSKVQAHWKQGLDVDTWIVVVVPRPFDAITMMQFPDKIGSIPWIQGAQAGALDSGDFQVDRVYFASAPLYPMIPGGALPMGKITIFAGLVAEVDTGSLIVCLTVNDYRELMTIDMPRNFYQAGCRHTLFDVACNNAGANPAANYVKNSMIGVGSTNSIIVAPTLPPPTGSKTYALGTITMTSGDNNTFSRTIADWDSFFTLSLVNPFPFDFAVGDTFTVTPGCDKQRPTCALFGSQPNGNQDNYGGEDEIPVPETAV